MENVQIVHLAGFLDSTLYIESKIGVDGIQILGKIRVTNSKSPKLHYLKDSFDNLNVSYTQVDRGLWIEDRTSMFVLLSHIKPYIKCINTWVDGALKALMD